METKKHVPDHPYHTLYKFETSFSIMAHRSLIHHIDLIDLTPISLQQNGAYYRH